MKSKKQQATEALEALLTYTWDLSYSKMWEHNPVDQTKKFSPSIEERISNFVNKFVK